jgi:5'-deoxynucleotidase YfbR-like HD superfamily hydrolase
MTPHSQGLIDIGKLALTFSKTNRVTLHEDGEYESNTDHTVMLSLCACALASALYKEKLDIGKVAQFAIVHDLVEAYVGDTNTINISDTARAEKDKREMGSLLKIEAEFKHIYPWIHTTIAEYERRDTPEARFVKTLDKSMTKITNTINKGAALRKLGTTREEIEKHFVTQLNEYRKKYGEEFPELMDITEELMNNMLQEIYV